MEPKIVTDDVLRRAELQRVQAQTEREEAERRRAEAEERQVVGRLNQPWWHIRLAVVLQVVVAGVVAGALIGGFLLDHFLKVSDLIQKQQAALEKSVEESTVQLQTERRENQRQLLDLNAKLKALEDGNNALKAELVIVELQQSRELERLESEVRAKDEIIAAERLTAAQLDRLQEAKAQDQAKIAALAREIDALERASQAANTRAGQITRQRLENYLRSNEWDLNDATGSVFRRRFEAGEGMRFRTSSGTWYASSMRWRIVAGVLILDGQGEDTDSQYPISSIELPVETIHGTSSWRGNETAGRLVRVGPKGD